MALTIIEVAIEVTKDNKKKFTCDGLWKYKRWVEINTECNRLVEALPDAGLYHPYYPTREEDESEWREVSLEDVNKHSIYDWSNKIYGDCSPKEIKTVLDALKSKDYEVIKSTTFMDSSSCIIKIGNKKYELEEFCESGIDGIRLIKDKVNSI